MHGQLSEFTLAQVLQFFTLAERSGTVQVRSKGRTSRLLVEGDKIIGWGLPSFDAREALLSCDLLPAATLDTIGDVRPRDDTPGLSFVVRNLIEPERWELFVQRMLEQDVYPLLSTEDGEFDVQIQRCPPAPLRLSLPINSLILDGSRWESEMEAAEIEGFALTTQWRRTHTHPSATRIRLTGLEWMVWSLLREPGDIRQVAQRVGAPDLATIGAIKRLSRVACIEREGA